MKEAHSQSVRELPEDQAHVCGTARIDKGAHMSENGNTNIVQNVYENFKTGDIKA